MNEEQATPLYPRVAYDELNKKNRLQLLLSLLKLIANWFRTAIFMQIPKRGKCNGCKLMRQCVFNFHQILKFFRVFFVLGFFSLGVKVWNFPSMIPIALSSSGLEETSLLPSSVYFGRVYFYSSVGIYLLRDDLRELYVVKQRGKPLTAY